MVALFHGRLYLPWRLLPRPLSSSRGLQPLLRIVWRSDLSWRTALDILGRHLWFDVLILIALLPGESSLRLPKVLLECWGPCSVSVVER
jgi:hypothetical protein